MADLGRARAPVLGLAAAAVAAVAIIAVFWGLGRADLAQNWFAGLAWAVTGDRAAVLAGAAAVFAILAALFGLGVPAALQLGGYRAGRAGLAALPGLPSFEAMLTTLGETKELRRLHAHLVRIGQDSAPVSSESDDGEGVFDLTGPPARLAPSDIASHLSAERWVDAEYRISWFRALPWLVLGVAAVLALFQAGLSTGQQATLAGTADAAIQAPLLIGLSLGLLVLGVGALGALIACTAALRL
jgi:hypothetical protein